MYLRMFAEKPALGRPVTSTNLDIMNYLIVYAEATGLRL